MTYRAFLLAIKAQINRCNRQTKPIAVAAKSKSTIEMSIRCEFPVSFTRPSSYANSDFDRDGRERKYIENTPKIMPRTSIK